jgi:hypothetical protein
MNDAGIRGANVRRLQTCPRQFDFSGPNIQLSRQARRVFRPAGLSSNVECSKNDTDRAVHRRSPVSCWWEQMAAKSGRLQEAKWNWE